MGYSQSREQSLSRVEDIFRDTAETGLQASFNKFWGAWQTVSTNASDNGARTALRERATELSELIQTDARQLKSIAEDLNSSVELGVDEINKISAEVLSLNKMIVNIEAGGSAHANDLRDRRDLLIDRLSNKIDIHVMEDKVGNFIVYTGGNNLVNGDNYMELGVRDDTKSRLYTDYGQKVSTVYIKSNDKEIFFSGGEMAGIMDSRDNTDNGVLGYLDKLNNISKFMLKDFNALHAQGFGTDNVSGRNFFDNKLLDTMPETDYSTWTPPPNTGSWIGALKVSVSLYTDTGLARIAAKPTATAGNANGEYAVKLSHALKRPLSDPDIGFIGTPTLGIHSLDSYYNSMTATLGVQSQNYQAIAANQKVVIKQITAWRESVSGVNLDEEMTNMIRFQKGYNASARVLTTMDEMLDKLINGTGVVGR